MENIEYKQDVTKDAEGQSLLNAGLGWRCPDCCGTGTVWMGVEAEVECSMCEGEGKVYVVPNVELTGLPLTEGENSNEQ